MSRGKAARAWRPGLPPLGAVDNRPERGRFPCDGRSREPSSPRLPRVPVMAELLVRNTRALKASDMLNGTVKGDVLERPHRIVAGRRLLGRIGGDRRGRADQEIIGLGRCHRLLAHLHDKCEVAAASTAVERSARRHHAAMKGNTLACRSSGRSWYSASRRAWKKPSSPQRHTKGGGGSRRRWRPCR